VEERKRGREDERQRGSESEREKRKDGEEASQTSDNGREEAHASIFVSLTPRCLAV
jgi:hypothetical protein